MRARRRKSRGNFIAISIARYIPLHLKSNPKIAPPNSRPRFAKVCAPPKAERAATAVNRSGRWARQSSVVDALPASPARVVRQTTTKSPISASPPGIVHAHAPRLKCGLTQPLTFQEPCVSSVTSRRNTAFIGNLPTRAAIPWRCASRSLNPMCASGGSVNTQYGTSRSPVLRAPPARLSLMIRKSSTETCVNRGCQHSRPLPRHRAPSSPDGR